MKKQLITKIIAGKYKNKVLQLPDLETTRSTKSIVKESCFNVLQYDIIDTTFIEMFAGSGSMGLEALSRGAKEVYFCEINKKSYSILDKNCQNIDANSTTTLFGDSFIQIPLLLKRLHDNPIILYIDPPFDFRENMQEVYQKSFNFIINIENKNIFIIIFEHFSRYNMPSTLGNFRLNKTKKFGKNSIRYYKYFTTES